MGGHGGRGVYFVTNADKLGAMVDHFPCPFQYTYGQTFGIWKSCSISLSGVEKPKEV